MEITRRISIGQQTPAFTRVDYDIQERYGRDDLQYVDAEFKMASISGNIAVLSKVETSLRNQHPQNVYRLCECLWILGKMKCEQDQHADGRRLLEEVVTLESMTKPQIRRFVVQALQILFLSYLDREQPGHCSVNCT